MISQSSDGELIARIASLSGWHAARGSSSRGGLKALDEMKLLLDKNHLAAHILDGPKRADWCPKKGVIHLVNGCDAALIPAFAKVENAWFCKSWDRFMVPKPFSRVEIHFGEAIRFEPLDSPEKIEEARVSVQQAMKPYLYE